MPPSNAFPSILLRVAEARQRDVGKGRARLNAKSLALLHIKPGEIVQIKGKRTTVASGWPADPEDAPEGTIRIDGQTRKNARITVNEFVKVRGCKPKEAKGVTLVPLGAKIPMDRDFQDFIKARIRQLAVTEGDDISVVVLGSILQFRVMGLSPKGVAKISETTQIAIKIGGPSQTEAEVPAITYEEIGGLKEPLRRLKEIVELPFRYPEVFERLGIEPPRGILLYGPPGCGKTLLAKALANESEATFLSLNGPEIMNKYYGETEAKLREIFRQAKEAAPSLIFIDEIDAIAPRREEAFGDVEKRVVAQLLALMDGLSERGQVVVIGASNRPEGLDPALRRPGRFDREVEIAVPNSGERYEILQIHTRGMPLAKSVNLAKLAAELHGYTGADLRALCREAALKSLRRILPEIEPTQDRVPSNILEKIVITNRDFKAAAAEIVPTALREFYIESPKVQWSAVGGLADVKHILERNVIWAIREPHRFHDLGVSPPRGVMLYGPPGCGKTMLAKALAGESGANFIMVRGPEIISKWVGESEKAVREIFRKAKSSPPCIVFLDEIDSLAKPRASYAEDSGVGDRVLSQLLVEIDSLKGSEVFILAATNRPDLMDISLLRPGRLDLLAYVPPPDAPSRLHILKICTSRMPLDESVSLDELAKRTEGYSGADIESLCLEAGLAFMETGARGGGIEMANFEHALQMVRPSISKELSSWYEGVGDRLRMGFTKAGTRPFYG